MPPFIIAHSYQLLIPLAVLEGPLLAIACGVGAGLGYLNPFIAYGILVGGNMLPDLLYYWLGRYGTNLPWVMRIVRRTHLLRAAYEPLEKYWRANPLATLASAKLAYGITPPFVVAGGLARVPFARFFIASLITSTAMLGVLGSVGYGLSYAYGPLALATGRAPYIIGAAGFGCFLLFIAVALGARRQLLSEEKAPFVA